MTRLIVLTPLFSSMVLFSCTQEQDTVPVSLPYDGLVDQRLIPYFRAFEYEASVRGVDIDFDLFPVEGFIRSIQEDDIAGTCSYNHFHPNVVTVDLEYWNSVSTNRREMVVFHELGHCILQRGHLETAFANGICTTIMNSGTSGCFIAYNAENRDYYLDELFAR